MKTALTMIVTAGLIGIAPTVRADDAADTATARSLGVEGVTLAEAGKCKEAIEKLVRAEKLHHAPTTATRLGECEVETGKLVVGTERLQRVIREPLPTNAHPAFAQAVARAQKALDTALPRLATLRLSVTGPEAAALVITIDGETVSDAILDTNRRIDPGAHAIEVRAPGFYTGAVSTSLAEGESRSVAVELRRDPSAAVRPEEAHTDASAKRSKLPAVIAFGAGAVSLGVGIYGATVVQERTSRLAGACDANHACPTSMRPVYDDAKTWATVATVGFVTAGVSVLTGAVLLGWSSSGGATTKTGMRVRPTFGVGAVGVDGVF